MSTPPSCFFPSCDAPAAFVVGHPGHELRLFQWLQTVHPLVFVVTDGSGSGNSRTEWTRELLVESGCTPGAMMGEFTDHEVYDAILSGESLPIAAATLRLSDQLIEHRVQWVVADKFELYNPTHDLCAFMAALAIERAQKLTGRTIGRYTYAVTTAPPAQGHAIELDAAGFERKMAAARRYPELGMEVDALVARVGLDGLRREVLESIPLEFDLPILESRPYYEWRGEQQVAAGRYRSVLRYEQHFVPFVRKLIAQFRAADRRLGTRREAPVVVP